MTSREQIRSYLADAIVHLSTAFAVAGMEGPHALIVSRRDKDALDALLRDLPYKKKDSDPRAFICGVEIRSE